MESGDGREGLVVSLVSWLRTAFSRPAAIDHTRVRAPQSALPECAYGFRWARESEELCILRDRVNGEGDRLKVALYSLNGGWRFVVHASWDRHVPSGTVCLSEADVLHELRIFDMLAGERGYTDAN